MTTPNDGSTALAKLRKRDYGLVISDCNMGPMTSFVLLQEMRADLALTEIPFIMGHGGIKPRT